MLSESVNHRNMSKILTDTPQLPLLPPPVAVPLRARAVTSGRPVGSAPADRADPPSKLHYFSFGIVLPTVTSLSYSTTNYCYYKLGSNYTDVMHPTDLTPISFDATRLFRSNLLPYPLQYLHSVSSLVHVREHLCARRSPLRDVVRADQLQSINTS